ncbi:hypothetical protein EVAR_74577_1 [Eumeta japonica]|uniref:Uncharacterized protein n=1 Tax=Eumeta variegata TaxID=151549 RepID=A0A4C1TF86_EUMVA|nr:hypothetical protein EVAR_74577_1 [Eumeta japonica]
MNSQAWQHGEGNLAGGPDNGQIQLSENRKGRVGATMRVRGANGRRPPPAEITRNPLRAAHSGLRPAAAARPVYDGSTSEKLKDVVSDLHTALTRRGGQVAEEADRESAGAAMRRVFYFVTRWHCLDI